MQIQLKPGDMVPHFSLPTEKGDIVSDLSLLGRRYVLFFYPKDDTPSCTKEACSIRDNYKYFSVNDYLIYGVSPDKEKKHQSYINKYEFPFSLLADTEKEMINAFGLWGPKKFMGREIVGVYRTTFIINEQGKIEHIIDKVKSKVHAQQLIEILGLSKTRSSEH